jgi:CubicO group peptidase (beta-lactamase class C family)
MRIVLRVCAVMATLAGVSLGADSLDDFYLRAIKERNVPSATMAVVKDGKVVKVGAYGTADLDRGIAAQPDTVYKIGSVSKQFIAAGIMLLAQDGRLSVDDAVSTYIPTAPSSWRQITLRHLLTHTSGLAREPPGFDPNKPKPDLEVISSAFATPLQWHPGDKYDYSNLGYYALAEVIRVRSGTPWNRFLDERIFVPLGMTSTRTTSADRARVPGYVWAGGRHIKADDWVALRPSGAFVSTVLDMAKWEAALQEDRILTPASKRVMWTAVKFNDGISFPYGFGWELDDFPPGGYTTGVRLVRHEGTIPGYRGVIAHFPDHRLGVIALTNLDRAQVDALVAVAAIQFVPELRVAALRRWTPAQLP